MTPSGITHGSVKRYHPRSAPCPDSFEAARPAASPLTGYLLPLDVDHSAVMQQAVKNGGRNNRIAKIFPNCPNSRLFVRTIEPRCCLVALAWSGLVGAYHTTTTKNWGAIGGTRWGGYT